MMILNDDYKAPEISLLDSVLAKSKWKFIYIENENTHKYETKDYYTNALRSQCSCLPNAFFHLRNA